MPDEVAAKPPPVRRNLKSAAGQWAKRGWAWLRSGRVAPLSRGAQFVVRNFNTLTATLLWGATVIFIAFFMYHGLTDYVTVIQPLSVPKALAETGYTPEVAGVRLRDALNDFVDAAKTSMRSPYFALQAELPNIAVPSVGISLDVVMSSTRTLLHNTRSRTITGEFVMVGGRLWLRLRIDGRHLYASKEGGDPEKPDDLLADAAPDVFNELKPYMVASWLAERDPAQALDKIQFITAKYPESDENVVRAYFLKGYIFSNREEYAAAKDALNTAIRLDATNPNAHLVLGNVWYLQKDYERALAEYRLAVKYAPESATGHSNLSAALRSDGQFNAATEEARRAIALDPKDAQAHVNLGVALYEQKNPGYAAAALDEFRLALKLDAKSVEAHNDLGYVLERVDNNNNNDAEREYRQAVKLNPRMIDALNNLGDLLLKLGRNSEAAAEFQAALAIDKEDVRAKDGLRRAGEPAKTGQ